MSHAPVLARQQRAEMEVWHVGMLYWDGGRYLQQREVCALAHMIQQAVDLLLAGVACHSRVDVRQQFPALQCDM